MRPQKGSDRLNTGLRGKSSGTKTERNSTLFTPLITYESGEMGLVARGMKWPSRQLGEGVSDKKFLPKGGKHWARTS